MSTAPTLRYRPALDGIRALAVGGVLLYHGNVPWVRGGFLGVDVFFVLSGYLITSLLLAEWDRWGAIDLAAFWARRARRLLPALLLMLIAVAVYAASLAPTTQRDAIRGDAVSTLLYVSNWRYLFTGNSYFAQFEAPSPLTHTWSLGIEEQWYIVFPLLMALVLVTWLHRRLLVTAGLLVAALASAGLMAALYEPGADLSRIYYGTDTRIQALLVGATLAALLSHVGERALGRRTVVALQVGGVAGAAALVLAFGFVQETQAWLFRGGFLAVAVASALVVAAVVTTDRGPAGRLLSVRALVVVGLVSYGVYLWHWPIYVALTPARTGMSGTPLLLLRLFVTGVVAAVSYVFLEKPIRQGRIGLGSRLVPGLAGATAAVLGFVLVVGQLAPSTAAAAITTAAGANGSGAVQASGATPSGSTQAFLLGDSVAFNLRSDFPASLYPGLVVTGSTQLGCGLVPDQLTAEGKVITPGADCLAWHSRIGGEIQRAAPQVGVLLVGSWEQYDRIVDGRLLTMGSPAFEQHIDAELGKLLAELDPASRPVVVMNVPCHKTPDFGLGPEPHVVNDENRVRTLNGIVERFVAGKGPNVHLLDFHGFLCTNGYTDTMNGVTLRTDGLHYTPEGAHLIWTWLAPQLEALAPGSAGPAPAATPTATPAPGPAGPVTTATGSVFLLGDSIAYNLRTELPAGLAPGLSVSGSTQLGCGLFPDPVDAAGKRLEPLPECKGWGSRWATELSAAHPDLVLLFPGIWEQFDRVMQGRVVPLSSVAMERYLDQRLTAIVDQVSKSAGAVALVTIPCHRVADAGVDPVPGIVNDDSRVDRMNTILLRFAAASGGRVKIVDLHGFLCGNGWTDSLEGVALHTDGLHYTPEGSRVVWTWLAPQVATLLATPAA